MTPEQALNLLDNAVSQINTNRVTHVELQKAVEILRNTIKLEKRETEAKDK